MRDRHLSPAAWPGKLQHLHARQHRGLDMVAAGTGGQLLWYLPQSWLHFAWAVQWTRSPLRQEKKVRNNLLPQPRNRSPTLPGAHSCFGPLWPKLLLDSLLNDNIPRALTSCWSCKATWITIRLPRFCTVSQDTTQGHIQYSFIKYDFWATTSSKDLVL